METLVPHAAADARTVTDPSADAKDGTQAAIGGASNASTDTDPARQGPLLPHVIVNDEVFNDPGYTPIDIYGQDGTAAIVASCPHAGRTYTAAMLHLADQPPGALRGLEDFVVDCLLGALPGTGISLVVNRLARGYLDVNRDITALDMTMFEDGAANSPLFASKNGHAVTALAKSDTHVRAGYGLLPRLTAARKPIYRHRLPVDEASRRIAAIHAPYHTALATLLDKAHAQHGSALLVDFHSMPGYDRMNNKLPDIILGDGHHTTLNHDTGQAIATHLAESGLTVGWNYPYSGGHITRHYCDARSTRQAVQIEINRNLYMDGDLRLNIDNSKSLVETIGRLGRFLTTLLSASSAQGG